MTIISTNASLDQEAQSRTRPKKLNLSKTKLNQTMKQKFVMTSPSRLKKSNQECNLPIWRRLAMRLAPKIWSIQLNHRSMPSWLARKGQDAVPNVRKVKNPPSARRMWSQSASTLIKNTTPKVCALIVTSSLAGKSAPSAAQTSPNTPRGFVKTATWRSIQKARGNRIRRPKRQQHSVPLICHHP